MRKWMLTWMLVLSLPAQATQDTREHNAVSQAWDRYAELSSKRDPAAAEELAKSTLRHFEFIRDATLYASVEQLRRVPLADRAIVLALRATQKADALQALDEAGLARLCIAQGYFGVPEPDEGESIPSISHATLLSADHAISELSPPNGAQYNFGSEFYREQGRWKVAPESLIADQELLLQQQIRSTSIKEDLMVTRLVAYLLDTDEAPNLIALEQPLLDDAMARTRLNEEWPQYDATYTARVKALDIKAAASDSTAQFVMGRLLVSGSMPKAAPKDEPRGWKLLEQASDGGNTDAAWLVFQYLMSQQKGYDETAVSKAVSHLQRAANAANPQAMASLADFYFDGVGGLTQDCRQAAAWMQRAEEAGVQMARNNLVWTWATCPIAEQRDPAKALQLVEYMVRKQDTLTAGQLDTVAAAYAANQQFDKAVHFQQLALTGLGKLDNADEARKATQKRMQARLRSYQNGQDYVQSTSAIKESLELSK